MSNDPDKNIYDSADGMWAPPDPTTRVGGDDNDKDQGKSVREAERDATKEGGNNSSRLAGEGFKSSVGKSGENKKIKFLTTRKKFFLAALAFGASAGVAAIIVFLPSIMFKTISEKLQQAFYDKADYALDQRMEKYVNQYIVDRYANVDGRCGTNVTKGCAFTPNSSTLYGYVAQTWQDNRIEEKLFQKYGIEFEKDLTDPTGQRIKVFKTNDYGVRGEVGTFGERQVLSEVKDLFKKETKAREIITRRHVRGILTGKFGAKYCLVACERRDELADSRISATNKLKLRLAARISEHLDARKTAYLLCMVSQCNTEGLERLNKELADEIISRADSELLEELAEELSSGRSRDLSEAIVKRFVEKAVLQITKEQTTARAAASGVPIAGQIYLGATLLEAVVALDEKVANGELSKYLYDMNIEASTNYAKQMETLSDDLWSMQTSPQDMGAAFSIMNGFGASRLWGSINGRDVSQSCDDGVVLSGDDQLVCPEKMPRQSILLEDIRNNDYVNLGMEGLLASYKLDVCPYVPRVDCSIRWATQRALGGVNWALDNTLGRVFSASLSLIKATPGVGDAIQSIEGFITNKAGDFFKWMGGVVFKTNVDPAAEDEQAFSQWAAGQNALAEQFTKGDPESGTGLGGKLLSEDEAVALETEIQSERLENLASRSLLDRLFSPTQPDSLVASSAVALAGVSSGGMGSPTINLLNPVAGISSHINSLFTDRASAGGDELMAISHRSEVFGIPSYGIPVDDPALTADINSLTTERCAEYESAREDSLDENGEYTLTNPCDIDSVIADGFTKIYDLDANGENSINTEFSGETPEIGDLTMDLPNVQEVPRCTGGQQPGTAELAEYVKERWAPTATGGYSCRGRSTDSSTLSVHASGRAIDQGFLVDNNAEYERANELFGWLVANAPEVGTQYVKFYKLQWSPNRGLTCVQSQSDIVTHSNHIHYEINPEAAQQQYPWYQNRTDKPPIRISQAIC